MIEWFREFRRRWDVVPHVGELERELVIVKSQLAFASKQWRTLQAQNDGWRQQDVTQRAEIERLIRDVGALERQLKSLDVKPASYVTDEEP